ncbi:pancreatic lipase-related protein 2-like [Uloborus diversus]|uniref:pancreatic lipase-related protein 2-like n=1 Tax=Uloborus diversus TaxID=327109 RepID=UPI0024098929|nr:pancreatic lipase-related protein 2-like [Uloborus diversus]
MVEREWRSILLDTIRTLIDSLPRRVSSLFVEKKACYDGYGCFSNGPPFYHPIYRPLSVPPQPPEVIKTMFLLHTRRNRNRPIFISPRRPKSIKKSTFEPTSLTRVIIHGLNDNLAVNSWFQRLKDVFLDRADENVIIVDWSGSNRFPYTVSVANTRLVGAQIAELIHFLYKSEGASPESFHLVGHSLGAHVAGYVGERLHNLGRITGLDPAGPFFRHVPEKVRLDPNDAVFVDVIHTDPGTSILQGFGTPEDAGDLDFFPGGGDPPGCEQTFSRSIVEDLPTEAISNLLSCQHLRSYEFFIYSFNQNGCLFVGVECASWPKFLKGGCDCGEDGEKCAIMGVFSPTYVAPHGYHHKDRRLYLKVGPERPFCVHQYQVTIYLHSETHQKTYGYQTVSVHLSVQGNLEKLEGELSLDIRLFETNQVKNFLLSTDRPIGDVESAFIKLYGKSTTHSEAYPFHSRYEPESDVIVDKIEINYLFPLPKHITSALLCKTSESSKSHGSREFQFSPKVCY